MIALIAGLGAGFILLVALIVLVWTRRWSSPEPVKPWKDLEQPRRCARACSDPEGATLVHKTRVRASHEVTRKTDIHTYGERPL